MPLEKSCGCKGIRTCLLCENQNNGSVVSCKIEENQHVFNYCSCCDLCWPDNEVTASLFDFPLYLGKIKLIPDFCTKEEESTIISSIDRIQWMPSQSGRKKQDFGPKVNFKKKKIKIGDFKGFPKFTETVINKFKDIPELTDFAPVELCHLEYTPERGSSIDPHVDDFWLWGERLVTVNLNSTSVLTLVPCSEIACECFQEANYGHFQTVREHSNETSQCKHVFQNGEVIEHSLKLFSKTHTTNYKSNSHDCELLKDDFQNLELFNKNEEDEKISLSSMTNQLKKIQNSETYCNNDTATKSFDYSDLKINKNEVLNKDHSDLKTIPDKTVASKTKTSFTSCTEIDCRINSMCKLFRTCSSDSKVCVRIVLPPRSLFVLSGCARYHWFHEIRRQDVASRRIAMTFRELSSEFLDDGKESQHGKDLLLIAKQFYDL